MESGNKEILQEMVKIELNAQSLYLLYQKHFSEDADFWGAIADEEATHGSLINLAIDVLDHDILDTIFTCDDLSHLKEANAGIREYIEGFEKKVPTKEDAYSFAINLEKMGHESLYEEKMVKKADSKQMEIFQKMNRECKNHAARIERLLATTE